MGQTVGDMSSTCSAYVLLDLCIECCQYDNSRGIKRLTISAGRCATKTNPEVDTANSDVHFCRYFHVNA